MCYNLINFFFFSYCVVRSIKAIYSGELPLKKIKKIWRDIENLFNSNAVELKQF